MHGTIKHMSKGDKPGMRIPPQSLDSERAVLGAIMLLPTAIQEIEDIISPEALYADKHRII